MKKILLLLVIACTTVTSTIAQSVDEILNNYFENTGGLDNWKALKGTKSNAKVDAQGMTIPLEIYNMADGKSLVKFVLQGKEMIQGAFDGETSWGINFMTMKPEKSDDETTENIKRTAGDYPSPFIDYKEKGYTVELLGEETVEGVECYKVKLTKKTMLVEGQEVDNIEYYYFDKENFVPILSESEIPSGPMKGQMAQTVYSDYQEVDGLYFPFSITSKLENGQVQTVQIESIELNPEVDDSMFIFPEDEEGTTE